MYDIAVSHSPHLMHHLKQGRAWLAASSSGEKTAALSYAAFELRLAIERLAVHYWAELLGRKLEGHDLRDIKSFKAVEQRIYELGGHQREIDRHFEFMRTLCAHLKISDRFRTPHIGQLAKYWHSCSELCHVAWILGSPLPELKADAFRMLTDVQQSLLTQLEGFCSWPAIRDNALAELRDRFVAGEADSRNVRAFLERTGAWARIEYPDGRGSEFIGEPIPPLDTPGAA